jgi:hypothetical protein
MVPKEEEIEEEEPKKSRGGSELSGRNTIL